MIDFENPIPLHIQIKELIKAEILEGKYTEKIPSERELMQRFSVSRSTVRESVNHLVHEGVLQKIHGKGTFITTKRSVHEWLDTLHSFTETVRKMGMIPGAKLLSIGESTDCSKGNEILQEENLCVIARLRTADDVPIAIERHYYRQDLGNQLKQFDLGQATIYDLIEKQLNLVIVEAEQVIQCCEITAEDAAQLGVKAAINVLCVERIITGVDGKALEYYVSLFHPTYYSLRLKTKRER